MKNKSTMAIFVGLFLSIIVFLMYRSSNTYSIEGTRIDAADAREALVETAWAYYRKGKYVQYDGNRRTNYASPEDATSQNTIYSVCSGFTFQTYYQTFGIELPWTTVSLADYAKAINNYECQDDECSERIETGNLVYYNEDKNEIRNIFDGVEDGSNTFMEELADLVMPGDLVVLRRGNISEDEEDDDNESETTGHVMIVEGIENGKIKMLHSSGSTYDYTNYVEKYESAGTIKIIDDLKTYLVSQNNSATNELRRLAVIRIIDDDLMYPNPKNVSNMLSLNDITDSAKSRLNYSLIYIDKVGSVSGRSVNNNVVNLNDVIEYTISIKNNSSRDYTDLIISEQLSQYVDFIEEISDERVVFDSNNFKWNITSVAPDETVVIKYRAKVKNDESLIGSQIISEGYVDDIRNATVVHNIGVNLTEDEKTSLINSYNEIKGSNTKYELDNIIDVYRNAGLDVYADKLEEIKPKISFDLVRLSDVICSKINMWSNRYCSYEIDDSISNILLNNYYGIMVDSSVSGKVFPVDSNNNPINRINPSFAWNMNVKYNFLDDRARYISVNNLEIGDILIRYTKNSNGDLRNMVFIYIGDGKLARRFASSYYMEYGVDGGNHFNNDNSLNNTVTVTSAYYLGNSIADYYVVLRPSLMNNRHLDSIEVTGLPTKTSYVKNSELLDLTGGVLSLKYNNGFIDTIELNSSDVNVSGFDNTELGENTIAVSYEGIETTFDVTIIDNANDDYLEFDDKLVVDKELNYIRGVDLGTSVSSLLRNVSTNGNIVVTNYLNEVLIDDQLVGNGTNIKVSLSNEVYNYRIIIYGDSNCDGKIGSADYVKIKKHIMDISKITDAVVLEGSDANRDGRVSSADYVRIKKYIMNES